MWWYCVQIRGTAGCECAEAKGASDPHDHQLRHSPHTQGQSVAVTLRPRTLSKSPPCRRQLHRESTKTACPDACTKTDSFFDFSALNGQDCLQLVFRSTALAKLLYASATWWGFANASEKNRLEAFLRRAGKSGYYTDDSLPSVAALCEQADEQQCFALSRTYFLILFLPPEHSTPYCTRSEVRSYATTNFPLK